MGISDYCVERGVCTTEGFTAIWQRVNEGVDVSWSDDRVEGRCVDQAGVEGHTMPGKHTENKQGLKDKMFLY